MAIIIKAPDEVNSLQNNKNIKLFLAGGITGCENWQKYVISELSNVDNLTIYSPRRENFPINDSKAAEEQIVWEYNHLKTADIIIFWFSRGSLNPIVLYELGMWGNSRIVSTVIGVDPQYERRQDVYFQTSLAKSELQIHNNLSDVIEEVKDIVREITDLINGDEDDD